MAGLHPMPNVWYRARVPGIGKTIIRLDPWPTYTIAPFDTIDLDLRAASKEDVAKVLESAPPLTKLVRDEETPSRTRCVPDHQQATIDGVDVGWWYFDEEYPDGWPFIDEGPPVGIEVDEDDMMTAKLALRGICVATKAMTPALKKASARFPHWVKQREFDLWGAGALARNPCVRYTAQWPKDATPATTLRALERIAGEAGVRNYWHLNCGQNPAGKQKCPLSPRWVAGLEHDEAQALVDRAWKVLEHLLRRNNHHALSLHRESESTLAFGLERDLPASAAARYECVEGIEVIVQAIAVTRALWSMPLEVLD